MTVVMRKIVRIDEDKCDGCGLCVPSCAEGAIRIIDGKARLLGENLCDGLGACLGECPQDAISIEERPAEGFDKEAVRRRHRQQDQQEVAKPAAACPGTMLRQPSRQGEAAPQAIDSSVRPSRLGQWPVQLALLPPAGDIWADADVLIAADCVPVVMPDFHGRLLTGKALAIACPKLDDIEPYIDKLTSIFANNNVRSVTVAHMEVPYCGGIVYAVRTALEQSERTDLSLRDITDGIDGAIQRQDEREVP